MIAEYHKFLQWVQDYFPYYERKGCWEIDYPDWRQIWSEFDRWLKFSSENEADYEAAVYLIARDNECEDLSRMLIDYPDIALKLAKYSLNTFHSEAKWQLAKVIAKIPGEEIDELIFKMSIDRSEFVQRTCMLESAKRRSKYAKEMIEWSWQTHDDLSMVTALWSAYYLHDKDLDRLLEIALDFNYPYLNNAVEEIQLIIAAQDYLMNGSDKPSSQGTETSTDG